MQAMSDSRSANYKSPEQQVKNGIFHWFEIQRFRCPEKCFVFNVNTTGIYDPRFGFYRKYRSRWSKNGTSDLIGSWKGRPLAIEVKAPGGKPSIHQVEFINNCLLAGWIAFVADSWTQVRDELAAADRGEKYRWQMPKGLTA